MLVRGVRGAWAFSEQRSERDFWEEWVSPCIAGQPPLAVCDFKRVTVTLRALGAPHGTRHKRVVELEEGLGCRV